MSLKLFEFLEYFIIGIFFDKIDQIWANWINY